MGLGFLGLPDPRSVGDLYINIRYPGLAHNPPSPSYLHGAKEALQASANGHKCKHVKRDVQEASMEERRREDTVD